MNPPVRVCTILRIIKNNIGKYPPNPAAQRTTNKISPPVMLVTYNNGDS